MDVREKLVELLCKIISPTITVGEQAAFLIANGVTVQGRCHKAESVISETGLMCTACYSDIDCDAVFCKYCGAKVMPQPPKGERRNDG